MDQNTFINTYIDIVINSLQDYVKANLQLQTQIKMNEFVISEKDKIISSLSEQIENNKIAEDWKTKYDAAEVNYSAVMSKLKHMDGLLNQLNEMKKLIIKKDHEIKLLNTQLSEHKSPKKVINTKIKKKEEEVSALIVEEKQEKNLDDF